MRPVASAVTYSAESNQIVRYVATELAPPFQVMDLQVAQGTAVLTAPAISLENVFSKGCIVFCIQCEPATPLAVRRRVW